MIRGCAIHASRCVAFFAALTLLAVDAQALRYQEHPPWMISLGWGFGRGHFSELSGAESRFRNGAAPQIHIGRKLSRHWMVNLSYEAWLIEFDQDLDPQQDRTDLIKQRETLQLFGLGVTLYPGNLESASGGIYIRASGGLGWAGKAEVEVFEDVALDHGHRVDLWGLGVAAGAGYDFWVSSNLQLGLGATINYFDIGEMVDDEFVGPVDVKDAWFASTLLNFNLFF